MGGQKRAVTAAGRLDWAGRPGLTDDDDDAHLSGWIVVAVAVADRLGMRRWVEALTTARRWGLVTAAENLAVKVCRGRNIQKRNKKRRTGV